MGGADAAALRPPAADALEVPRLPLSRVHGRFVSFGVSTVWVTPKPQKTYERGRRLAPGATGCPCASRYWHGFIVITQLTLRFFFSGACAFFFFLSPALDFCTALSPALCTGRAG